MRVNAGVGDCVVGSSNWHGRRPLAQIVRATKTQLVATRESGGEFRIMKGTGRQVGSSGSYRSMVWRELEKDETASGIQAKNATIQANLDKKDSEQEERARQKLKLAQEMLVEPYLERLLVAEFPFEIHSLTLVTREYGKTTLVWHTETEETVDWHEAREQEAAGEYIEYDPPTRMEYRVNVTAYYVSHHKYRQDSRHGSHRTKSEFESLAGVVASNFL